MGRTYRVIAIIAAVTVVVTAATLVDWRFWYRWHTLPQDAGEWPDSFYQPAITIPGDAKPFFPSADPDQLTIASTALEAAADWAEEHNAAALLILHKGVVQLERYWQDIGPDTPFTGRAMTRSLIPVVIAMAIEDGHIASVDDPVGRYIPEWSDDPRGGITIRQLMHNVSGLENPALEGDADPGNKNNRLSLGSNMRRAALRFELEHEPGEFFQLSNANAQLLGVLLESATGENYQDYLNRRLWAPLGAGPAIFYMDRPNGMPATYCCFRATPRDWLRVGAALSRDGMTASGQRLWAAGWVAEMTTPSAVNPNYGYQIWTGNPPGTLRPYVQGGSFGVRHGPPIDADAVYFLEGGGHRMLYVLPEQELVILRLGYFHPDWQTSTLPNLVLAGIEADGV
ncbi:MAG: serine hydrolase [Gammaproteobacteria bacterium]|nr:serine hydrolase [Gammaproteobacteria bacterium]TVQ49408.1 MAG: class C beta-lactamase-related serine hydrolase [Gammaproteobacteria bacterium]